MSERKSDFTRRALFAAAGAGVTLAAVAAARPLFSFRPERRFQTEFRSPFSSLATGDHNVWSAAVGQTMALGTAHMVRVVGVEKFVPFGKGARRSTRSRAFMVSFDIVSGGPVAGDTVHRITHPNYGSFDLFLMAPAKAPARLQAMFS